MQIAGTNTIAAPGLAVWNALNDPEVLRRCLPGCESVERTSAEEFRIVMTAAVGPLKARFNGKLRMSDARPPSGCVLHFEGQGGAMGFGKGMSTVSLRETGEGTELSYTAEAQVGGKLAQVGSRLVDGVARKMSDDFFQAFRQQFVAQETAAEAPRAAHAALVEERPVASEVIAPALAAAASVEPAAFLVPAWWLGPAAILGALVAIAGSRLLH